MSTYLDQVPPEIKNLVFLGESYYTRKVIYVIFMIYIYNLQIQNVQNKEIALIK